MIRAASKVSRQHQRVGGCVAVRGLRLSPSLRNQAGVPVSKPPAPPVIKTNTTIPPPPVVETTHVHLPPPPPPKKKFSLFRFLLGTTLLTAVVYGGTLYAATKNDDVMDFIIDKNPPYYEELLDFIENGSIEDLQKGFDSLKNRVSNFSLPSSDQIGELKSQIEKSSGDLIKDTKDKFGSVGKAEPFNAPDATPEQQLQKPVEIESVKKDVEKLPLIELTKNAEKTLDASVKATIESFNNLIRSIDTSKLDNSTSSSNLVKLVQESVDKLAHKVDSLSNDFESELKARLKTAQTELLSSYTAKELELTENFVNQFNNEKGKLEAKLNKRLEQEIQATKEAISQAAVNAVSMVRIEQTKNFEKMVKDKLDQERNGRLANLEQLDQKLNELEKFAESLEAQLTANQTKASIHNSLTKLKTVLFNSSDPSQAPKFVQPYVEDLAIQTKGSKDEVIQLALNELSRLLAKESSHSILTTSQLLSRWELLAPELRSASLLPPNAGLLGHLTSSLFSKLLFPVKGAKPDGKDIESVIGRVEASLVRGDLDVAIEEAANLKGWPRKLADDWVVEGRKRLEAQFLVDLIDAESRIL